MNDLQALENELNRLYAYKNDIEVGRRPYNQWEYNELMNTINGLAQTRESMYNQMRYNNQYNNGYYPNNGGYIDPRYQQNSNSLTNRNGFGIANQPVGYYPPNMTSSGSDDGNNRFAKKATSIPQTQVFQQQPQQPIQQSKPVVQQEQLKPQEGNEFILVTAQGLECRKEVSNGWYRYEIYGDMKTVSDLKVEDLATNLTTIWDAKKFCLEKSLDAVTGKLVKRIYGKTDPSVDIKSVNTKISSSGIINGILASKLISSNLVKYLDTAFTNIFNACVVGGMKKKQKIETIVGDLEDMSNIVKADSVRLQTFYNTIKDAIQQDIASHLSVDLNNDVYTFTDKIPFIYVESKLLLGNLDEVIRNNDIACITKDSNPGLYSLFQKYFDKDKQLMYVMVYAIDDDQEVNKFIVCKDINNNFIIAA